MEVATLDFQPGVYSARFAGPKKDNKANIDLLLKKLWKRTDRGAQFRTIIALILKQKTYYFKSAIQGTITEEKKGTNGFGYDSIFYPKITLEPFPK